MSSTKEKSQGKRWWPDISEGLFRRQSGRGQLWGDSEWPWCSFCPTISQHLHERKAYWLFWWVWGPCGHRDISDPRPNKNGHYHSEAHRCHAPGFPGEGSCHRVIPSFHTQQGSPGPTSLPLFLTALRFMFYHQYPALYYLHHQRHRLPSASSSLHPQGEGTTLRVGSQKGTCRNQVVSGSGRKLVQGGRRPLSAMSQHGRCSWAPVVGPVPPTTPTTWK